MYIYSVIFPDSFDDLNFSPLIVSMALIEVWAMSGKKVVIVRCSVFICTDFPFYSIFLIHFARRDIHCSRIELLVAVS